MQTQQTEKEVVAEVKAEVSELKWEVDVDFSNLDSDAIWYMVGLAKLTKQVQKVRVSGHICSKYDAEHGYGKEGDILTRIRFENDRTMEQLKDMGVKVDVSQIQTAYKTAYVLRVKEVEELKARKHASDKEKRKANWNQLPMVVLANIFPGGKLTMTDKEKAHYIETGNRPDHIRYAEKYKKEELEISININSNGRWEVELRKPWVSTSGSGRYGRRRFTSQYNETHRCKKVEKAVEFIHECIAQGHRIIDSREVEQNTRVTLQTKFEKLLGVDLIPDKENEYNFSIVLKKNEKEEYGPKKSMTISLSEKGSIQIRGMQGLFSVDAVKTMIDLLQNAQYC